MANGEKYKFATVKENYEDYSSGRVLYGAPGATGFPVRLISEMFQRAVAILQSAGIKPPYSIYDPFCGTGYSLTVVGLLHGELIRIINASDINTEAVETAKKNLTLLTKEGIKNRFAELEQLLQLYNKTSHQDALESAERLKVKVPGIHANCFSLDILGAGKLPLAPLSIDIVLCDLPYGKLTKWENGSGSEVHDFLSKIKPLLKPQSVVAISDDKKQKIAHEAYKRIEFLKTGKRQVVFLTLLNI